jgi:hypothetical protein
VSGGIVGGQYYVTFGADPPKDYSSYDGKILVKRLGGFGLSEKTYFSTVSGSKNTYSALTTKFYAQVRPTMY